LAKNVQSALEHRNTKVTDQERDKFVVVKSDILKEMQATPFLSSKRIFHLKTALETPGRGVYLLQQKIMERKMYKPQKKFPLLISPL
jgi:hypothetical protein